MTSCIEWQLGHPELSFQLSFQWQLEYGEEDFKEGRFYHRIYKIADLNGGGRGGG